MVIENQKEHSGYSRRKSSWKKLRRNGDRWWPLANANKRKKYYG